MLPNNYNSSGEELTLPSARRKKVRLSFFSSNVEFDNNLLETSKCELDRCREVTILITYNGKTMGANLNCIPGSSVEAVQQ